MERLGGAWRGKGAPQLDKNAVLIRRGRKYTLSHCNGQIATRADVTAELHGLLCKNDLHNLEVR